MAVQQVLNPDNVPGGVTTGYQRQNTLLYATNAGYINIGLTNIDNTSAPQIMDGSVIEVNGAVYKCNGNESIAGTPTNNQVNYIYIVPNGTTASFSYSSTAPTWNPAKGSWYNGNNRAIGKLFYTSSQYNGKVILDSYNAMNMINTNQSIPLTGGRSMVTGVINSEVGTVLFPGVYRYDLKGGKGGNGGSAYAGAGGEGADGEQVVGTLIVLKPMTVMLSTGGNGNDGDDARSDAAGGGGCTGGVSYIRENSSLIALALGGSGGGGAADDNDSETKSSLGGGGGGGYGTGGDGASTREGFAAKGGSNNVGGAGGNSGRSTGAGIGGDGSGYNSNYGQSGSNGMAAKFTGETIVYVVDGKGGSSMKLTSAFDEKITGPVYRNAYQGGGGGGSYFSADYGSGNGGGGLKSTSSGYCYIYRMW
ncbi:MAG: hypothetical protein LBT14_07235 [Treponema sp.]|jgi:hypothetical protein|nr:hypothetical protein [Treponema sp.]